MENIRSSESKFDGEEYRRKLMSMIIDRIVGGIETLSAMEAIPTDDKDRPQVR